MAFDEDPTHLIPERTEANSDDTKRIKKKPLHYKQNILLQINWKHKSTALQKCYLQ